MQLSNASPLTGLFSRLYFVTQSLRGGVEAAQISFAQRLLDSDRPTLLEHVRQRLIDVHGATQDAFDWLAKQPLSDRAGLRGEMMQQLVEAPRRAIEVRKTSGSTGAPFRFVKDRRMTAMMDAVMWAVYGWHGIAPGQKHARFWGMPRERLPRLRREIMDFLLHRRRLNAFDLTPDAAAIFFQRLRQFRPHYIHAYPNLLLAFIDYCAETDLDGRELGVSTVVCGGELLPPTSRQRIEEYFDARVVNEYGCSESGLISIDCEAGRPHLLPVAVYPELVEKEVERDGSVRGNVIITDLYGSIMPLLRYQLHDHARVIEGDSCACGRDLAVLSPLIGRVDTFIQTPSKGKLYDAILAYTVPPGVLRFRAYQISDSRLFVEAVLDPGASPRSSLDRLESIWEKELGPGMIVDAVAVDEIPTLTSGKLAYFVPEEDVPAGVRQRAAT